jgi:hypothetical protein
MRKTDSSLFARVTLCWYRAVACILAWVVATAAVGPQGDSSASMADEPSCDLNRVDLRFVASDTKMPLAGIHVEVTSGYGDDQQKFGPFQTDDVGTIQISLPKGSYSLHLKADEELPYLPVEVLWDKQSRGPRPDLSLSVKESGAEKWLSGKRRKAGYKPPATPGDAPLITYTLLPACELVLSAVDADTGKGLAGATFYEENAVGEEWAHSIDGDNLGWKAVADDQPTAAEVNQTGSDGAFRRFVGANAGYKYGVESSPAGYEPVERAAEVEIDIPYGKARAEHVFKFRRVKDDSR